MTLLYRPLVALGIALLVGNYTAWGASELGYSAFMVMGVIASLLAGIVVLGIFAWAERTTD